MAARRSRMLRAPRLRVRTGTRQYHGERHELG